MNTGVEGTEEFQRINAGEIRHSNVWIVESDSDNLWFRMGAAYKSVNQGHGHRNECSLFFGGTQTALEAEARRSMERQLYGLHLSVAEVM